MDSQNNYNSNFTSTSPVGNYSPATSNNNMIDTNHRSLQEEDSAAKNMDYANIPARLRSNTAISDVTDVMMPTIISFSSISDSDGSTTKTTTNTEKYFASTELNLDTSSKASSTLLAASLVSMDVINSYNATTFNKNHDFLRKADSNCTDNILEPSQQHTHTQLHPETKLMKRNRRDKTATFGVGGAVVGTIILPVVGTFVGGAISGYSTNLYMKRNERRVQRKWERDQFQKHANESPAVDAVFV